MTTPRRRLLIVSPHFPPDASAGAHRARVLAPYLSDCGWDPIVVTVNPAGYEGALDPELGASLDRRVPVIRVPIWPAARTRRVGLGDLGLRAFVPLYRVARLQRADAIYLTTYPVYPAAFAPRLKRAIGAPLVIDLQDPWVGAWGLTVGGGPNGRPDWKSRASRALASRIEAVAIPAADALTSVSSGLLDELASRYPSAAARPRLTLPIGIDPRDVEALGTAVPARVDEESAPFTLTYVGTLLPLAGDTLDAVLRAVKRVHECGGAPPIRVRFVGTSNQSRGGEPERVRPRAEALGLAPVVEERPRRVPYFDALRMLAGSSATLVMGTSESRYTASKVQGALAAGRPVLAVVHAGSDVARTLEPLAARDGAIALFTYDDDRRPATLVEPLAARLAAWQSALPRRRPDTRFAPGTTGPELAQALATLLDAVRARRG